MNILIRLDLGPYDILMAVGDQLVDLLFRQGQRVTHLLTSRRVVLEVRNCLTFFLQLSRRIERDVGMTGFQELVDIFLIDIAAFALAVRTVVASEADALVEPDTQPSECLNDVILGAGHETLRVGILDT